MTYYRIDRTMTFYKFDGKNFDTGTTKKEIFRNFKSVIKGAKNDSELLYIIATALELQEGSVYTDCITGKPKIKNGMPEASSTTYDFFEPYEIVWLVQEAVKRSEEINNKNYTD